MPTPSLQDLRAAKQQLSRRFLKSRGPSRAITTFAVSAPSINVVGVGVGPKISDGKETKTRSVRIYVEHKIPLSALSKTDLLPDKIDGIPTDIVETGRFRRFDAATASANKLKRRPARPGCSIGFKFPPPPSPKSGFVMAGTFGAVVQKNGKRHILSNNHVLAENGLIATGGGIFEPGLLDGGDDSTDQIATLAEFIAINRTSNVADCALALVDSNALVSPTPMPKVGKLKSANPIDAKVGMKVHKTGRTTGYTKGAVFDVMADVTVDGYEDSAGEFSAFFPDQITIVGAPGIFSDAGDSGSLIVDQATQRATGLLFAGSSTHTIACHFSAVASALGITLEI